MTAVTAATAWRVSKSDMWKLRLHTLGFIKSKDIYGGGEIKRGMRENESLSELGLLTAGNVSPSGASTVIHHLRRYNRSWPRVTEDRPSVFYYSASILSRLSETSTQAHIILLQIYCITHTSFSWCSFKFIFAKKSLILGDHKYKYTVYIEREISELSLPISNQRLLATQQINVKKENLKCYIFGGTNTHTYIWVYQIKLKI